MSTPFTFTPENAARAKTIMARYPDGRQQSAIIPLLDIAQRQNGNWLSREAIQFVAETVGVPLIRAYEVATFYTMFNLKPVGRHFIQLCATTPCWLRGSDAVEAVCKDKLGIGLKQTTPDGEFTLMRVECLGACVNAPVVQINDDYYEDVTPERMAEIIDALKRGEKPACGSQTNRQFSAPAGIQPVSTPAA
jgi:NADH dehydrogenase (ubiquinone) flavoprotein 2